MSTFTDSSPAGINVKAVHITELRTALNAARSALGLTASTYSQTPSAGTSLIKAADFTELRNGVK